MPSRILALFIAAIVCLCSFAFGQEDADDEGLSGGFPLIRRHQLDLYAEVLEFDAGQREALQVLWQGYRLAIREEAERVRSLSERLQKAYEENTDAIMNGDMSSISALQDEVVREQMRSPKRFLSIEADFASDIKSILSERQADLAPRYERSRRRHMFLGESEFPGWAGVDLIDIVYSLKLPHEERAALREELIDYEQRVDRPLKETFDFLTAMLDRFATGEDIDDDGAEETIMQKMSLMVEINKGALARAGALLGEGSARRLADEANRRAFPFVYRVSPVTRAIDAALKLEDMTDDQRVQIDALRPAYESQLRSANLAWANMLEARLKDSIGPDRGQIYEDFNEWPAPVQARAELDARFRQRLDAILTREQAEKLAPAPDKTYYQEWVAFEDGHVEYNSEDR